MHTTQSQVSISDQLIDGALLHCSVAQVYNYTWIESLLYPVPTANLLLQYMLQTQLL